MSLWWIQAAIRQVSQSEALDSNNNEYSAQGIGDPKVDSYGEIMAASKEQRDRLFQIEGKVDFLIETSSFPARHVDSESNQGSLMPGDDHHQLFQTEANTQTILASSERIENSVRARRSQSNGSFSAPCQARQDEFLAVTPNAQLARLEGDLEATRSLIRDFNHVFAEIKRDADSLQRYEPSQNSRGDSLLTFAGAAAGAAVGSVGADIIKSSIKKRQDENSTKVSKSYYAATLLKLPHSRRISERLWKESVLLDSEKKSMGRPALCLFRKTEKSIIERAANS